MGLQVQVLDLAQVLGDGGLADLQLAGGAAVGQFLHSDLDQYVALAAGEPQAPAAATFGVEDAEVDGAQLGLADLQVAGRFLAAEARGQRAQDGFSVRVRSLSGRGRTSASWIR